MAKHPAENLIRFFMVRDPAVTDGSIQKMLEDWGFLTVDPTYLPLLRQEIPAPPAGFNPGDKAHRASVTYLRDLKLYEFFHPNDAAEDAWRVLSIPDQRMAAEQILLARLDLAVTAKKINAKRGWDFTEKMLKMYQHFFWNVPSLTFDEWGRYMFNRTSLYEHYMGLLIASPMLAFYHLRLDQTVESKRMIQRTQEIAYFTMEEVAQKPGVHIDKVKSLSMLSKTINECHQSLSTSDMALKDVLRQFEHWRMEHPQITPPALNLLAPAGNHSGSGQDKKEAEVIELHPEP
jgi:hypothetical protein